MSVGSLPPVLVTVILSSCLFSQEKAISASTFESATDQSFMSGQSTNANPAASPAPPNPALENRWKDPSAWQIAIYPVFVWAPVFGISTRELPNSPGGGGGGNLLPPSDSSSSFNGAAFAGFRVEKSKWSADGSVLWAGLSSERDSDPFARITVDAVFGQLFAGREIVPNLFLEGGFRRMALDVSLTLGSFPTVSGRPGVWDPLVGLTYRRQLTKKWKVFAHADGGGFGVGSDVDVGVTARAEWQFARHFGMAMGYGLLHFNITSTIDQRRLEVKQTLNGPILGFGIFF